MNRVNQVTLFLVDFLYMPKHLGKIQVNLTVS